ncbi:MAG: sodium:proline symporter [Candidatus Omnitrophica bacterium CG07_land_8_20_14_0_80_42_15]|uniref:Sodium:proline symporter n=1 Tax=Candidatus Aquitaenariimonas noxiae TaxID=1974741 RepID=A0A2J0KZ51_9BACT|nr:MAG: sodium:proline symporter [Candidatus Omnitrophica bacterium CG07_land_8_20_14_0_80_42_15]
MDGFLMVLSKVDWAIIIGYMLISVSIGMYFTKKGSKSIVDYFVAGREVHWLLAGTSIVATSFAADTPLAISAIVRTRGLQGNWYWWSGVMGGVLCVFFYARLWRRAKLITDAEFMEIRYHGKPAAFLRGFHAAYRSIFWNSVVLGWVILAMYKVVHVLLGWPKVLTTWSLISIAVIYISFSGLWGVLATDFFQFILAMTGCIILAGIVLVKTGGPAALVEKSVAAANALQGAHLQSNIADGSQLASIFPNVESSTLAVITFLVFILVQWWGGGEGGGFLAQRLFSCKNEKHSLYAVLWFNFAHYAIRPWPWIIVGLGSVIYFPNLADPETAFPCMMIKFLPNGLRGMMVAAFFAAFMSCTVTHINWGASYLVNDIYKRFLFKKGTEKHYLFMSRVAIILMTCLAGTACMMMTSIYSAWLFIMSLMVGTSAIVLLRWYWWRINVWSEITSLISSAVISILLLQPSFSKFVGMPRLWTDEYYPIRLVITLFACTGLSLLVAFLTPPEPDDHLEKFFRRVRPGGWWGHIAERCKDVKKLHLGWPEAVNWLLTVISIYAALFGLGWLVMGKYWRGTISMIISFVTIRLIVRLIDKMEWDH